MEDRVKLPFEFNVEKLKADVANIEARQHDWIDHFVTSNYEGNWSVIPLRGTKGATHPVKMIFSDPTIDEFEFTPFLEGCDYLKEVLNSFKCELLATRLMKLSSNSVIKEHHDYDLDFEMGTIRVHVPIITNPDVKFTLNGSRVVMDEGSCWYLRLSDLHSVTNTGPDRVHLVIDMKVNDWWREQLEN